VTAPFLPYAMHSIDDADIDAVGNVLREGMLTGGPAVESLERRFVDTVQATHAVACSSGTAALHLAAMALGWHADDRIIVPSVTFLATANMARFVGADVVFSDVDPETGLMTAETLEAALEKAGPAARAVVPVHLAGQTADMAAIAAMARPHGLAVVEDACHALGTIVPEGPVGNCQYSDVATFSLHPAKTVAMGEGGVATTNDTELAESMARLRNHGMERDPAVFEISDQGFDEEGAANPWYYEMREIGFNYRVSDILCALGDSQLSRLAQLVARRKKLVARYDTMLAPLAPVIRPAGRIAECDPAWHLYVVLIDFEALGLGRGALMRRLFAEGIGTQVHYLPVHRQPYYRRLYGEQDLPGADAYYDRTLSVPLFPAMSDGDVERVVEALRRIVEAG
jgi:UDP-4-amino-4,6-dideoxy-N-acetyl-beta-L-altrosamine transaminase